MTRAKGFAPVSQNQSRFEAKQGSTTCSRRTSDFVLGDVDDADMRGGSFHVRGFSREAGESRPANVTKRGS